MEDGTQEGDGNVLDQFFVTEGNEPTQLGGEPMQPDGEPTQPGSEPTQPGGEPTQPGGEPTQPGGEPTQPGSEPTQPGGEPTQPGGEPTQPGGEPTAAGRGTHAAGQRTHAAGQRTHAAGQRTAQPGGEPTQPGGEPTQPGGEPTQPGGESTQPGGEQTGGEQTGGEQTGGEQTGGEETGEQPPEEGGEEAPAAQAWVNAGGEEPVRGDLADLLGTYSGYTIYLSTKDVIKLSGYTVEQMESYTLQPDPVCIRTATRFHFRRRPAGGRVAQDVGIDARGGQLLGCLCVGGAQGHLAPARGRLDEGSERGGRGNRVHRRLAERRAGTAALGSVIYLQTPRVLEIEGYTVEQLEAFDIRPDDGMFSGGVVLISSSDPREEYDPDAPVGETVYVWWARKAAGRRPPRC